MTSPTATGNPAATPALITAELEDLVAQHWDPDQSLAKWRTELVASGLAVPSWPVEWHGRGWPAWTESFVAEELERLGVPGVPTGAAMSIAAPTILELGTDELRERFLLPALTGQETWCQLFSEPGAGSDLAGLTCTAVLEGDTWIVNGQKVWNSSADHADFGILIARTDWEAPKHRGLTYFLIEMHQPGVTVRPLRQMNDYASFNEVFLEGARIPKEWVVGGPGGGWAAAMATLGYERKFGFGATESPRETQPGQAFDELRAEWDERHETYKWYPQRAGRVDLVVSHAREAGVVDDPVIRQGIAQVLSLQAVAEWTAARARANRAAGKNPGAEGSIGKLASSQIARASARLHADIAGMGGLVTGPDAPDDGITAEIVMSVPSHSIAGGTDEIQKNVLAEKVLGLPREPAPHRQLAFSQTRRN